MVVLINRQIGKRTLFLTQTERLFWLIDGGLAAPTQRKE
jgi:hypothetical protein